MSVAAPELRAWPVPVSEPWAASAHPVGPRRRGPAQDVLPLGAALPASLVDAAGTLKVTARPRARRLPLTPPAAATWEEDDDGPRPTPLAELPEASTLARKIAGDTLESLAGARPASQLLRWMAADVYAQVSTRCATAAARRRPGTPLPRTAVRKVRCSSPSANAVEVAAVVLVGSRVKAMALRMEGWDGRWRVTALDLR